ncbi:protein lin-52 homolog isoform X1 [Acipenser ruthenus]|uniref:protein lin-52 homolog isoform X1 n=1 Tax=Acipenser ruthenus TaxID=7906 RepID=UPI00274145E8|nr:protein lin-52 homolog isoform X1 [Acipenser ruthenus]
MKCGSFITKTVNQSGFFFQEHPLRLSVMHFIFPGEDFETSLLSFEKLDRASPDLWPEQLPGVAEFAASFKSPITNSPPKWMAELENDDIEMLKELGSLTTANLMEKVKGLQNLAYQLGLEESREMTRGKFLNILEKPKK